jgi:pimeloyl-ACP methyl ester carboxylesterase
MLAGPYVLVGHSLGGLFARLYASTYPDEVIVLVLVDPLFRTARIIADARAVGGPGAANVRFGADTVKPIRVRRPRDSRIRQRQPRDA